MSYGLKIGIRFNTPEVPPEVFACLPPGWQPAEPPFVDLLLSVKLSRSLPGDKVRQYHLAYLGLKRIVRSMDLNEVYESLENNLQLHIAEHARDRIFLHAGVVGWQGKAIVLPGRSFAGKSTLVAALVRAGAEYYSDEYSVLDENGLVHLYPRRLALRQGKGKPAQRCLPEDLGGATGSQPLPAGVIALTRYQTAGRWQPRPLSPGKAVLELLNHTVPVQSKPAESMAFLQRALAGTTLLKGQRGEAEATATELLRAA